MFKVMIVDDMEIIREKLKKLKIWSEESGFIIVDEAKNGQEALRKLEKITVDIIITDIKMPIMNGIELLKNVMQKELCFCVIFLSEYADFEYARQGLAYGVFDYIIKPINDDKIGKVLERAKKYITVRKTERERIKSLEIRFEKKIENLYSYKDLEKIIKLINDVDLTAINLASTIIEIIFEVIDYDLIKITYVLNKMLKDLVKAMEETYPWLNKLANISKYINIDFENYSDFYNKKEAFLQIINEFIEKIKKFECRNGVNSMTKQVCKTVLENIDRKISTGIIADMMFLNISYLSTVYKKDTGNSIIEYITMVKMERAKILLVGRGMKNNEIIDLLGYKSTGYFYKLFKNYTGMSPLQFKQRYIFEK